MSSLCYVSVSYEEQLTLERETFCRPRSEMEIPVSSSSPTALRCEAWGMRFHLPCHPHPMEPWLQAKKGFGRQLPLTHPVWTRAAPRHHHLLSIRLWSSLSDRFRDWSADHVLERNAGGRDLQHALVTGCNDYSFLNRTDCLSGKNPNPDRSISG